MDVCYRPVNENSDLRSTAHSQSRITKKKRSAKIPPWRFELAGYLVSMRTARNMPSKSRREVSMRALHVLRQNDWIDVIHQNSTITIAVKEPQVEHKVRIRDFESWLASNAKSPAEQALKSDLRALLNARMEEKPARRG
jgi:hypothetical protein